MNLSKQIQEVLTYIDGIEIPTTLTSPQEQGRAFYEQFIPMAGNKEEVYLTKDQLLAIENHQIPLRIYRPNNQPVLPAIVYFHGGWFNAGSLETHDTPLRQIANQTQAIIISVDYRLAPEHPFPAGLQDCEAAVSWVIDQALFLGIQPNQIAIAGDSAGAALATTITRKLRHKISAQILIYPVTDNSLSSASWTTYKNGPILNLNGAIEAWQWYLPHHKDHSNPDAIPLFANDLEQLPPTFIAIADHDPLKDEAIVYAKKLQQQNNTVSIKTYEETTHGFFQMGVYFSQADVLIRDIANFLQTSNLSK
ncbi:MAG: alpha/beta hydrolase [Flavobacteriaceae bacterium]|jgi:acetyl esterase|nr:alpha/beta hydrolase [Flavobacteriaceae bacterium]